MFMKIQPVAFTELADRQIYRYKHHVKHTVHTGGKKWTKKTQKIHDARRHQLCTVNITSITTNKWLEFNQYTVCTWPVHNMFQPKTTFLVLMLFPVCAYEIHFHFGLIFHCRNKWRKRSEETQTLHAGCSKAEPKISPRRRPPSRGRGTAKI